MKGTPIRRCLLLALLLLTLLSACGPTVRSVRPAGDQQPVFRPPTPVNAVQPTATFTPSAALLDPNQPTPTVTCKDNLTFITDATIPDGTTVQVDSTLDKRWEVENSGNCNWLETYRVRLIAGPDLGAQPEQALYPARSGTRATLRIVFKAPTEPGSYRSAWQAFDPQGEPFGDPFFIEIKVE